MKKDYLTLEQNLSSDIKVITKYTKMQERFINLGGYEFETKISKVLSVFDITEEMLGRNFNTLSGGEKTTCSLIRLILIEPDILLLDEPTNHLDIKRIEWLEKYLNSIKSTIILLVGGFITKVLGMIIKIVMSRMIGPEILGLYMMILPTFSLFIGISQFGMPIALSKLIAEDKKNNKKLFFSVIPISLFVNFLFFLHKNAGQPDKYAL